MNMTSSAGASAKSAGPTGAPPVSGSRKSGAFAPRACIVDGVNTMTGRSRLSPKILSREGTPSGLDGLRVDPDHDLFADQVVGLAGVADPEVLAVQGEL